MEMFQVFDHCIVKEKRKTKIENHALRKKNMMIIHVIIMIIIIIINNDGGGGGDDDVDDDDNDNNDRYLCSKTWSSYLERFIAIKYCCWAIISKYLYIYLWHPCATPQRSSSWGTQRLTRLVCVCVCGGGGGGGGGYSGALLLVLLAYMKSSHYYHSALCAFTQRVNLSKGNGFTLDSICFVYNFWEVIPDTKLTTVDEWTWFIQGHS